ncbi:hypothetical protein Acr_10g0003260 [Actinidia rufa]|uniref:Uncharacterized protein n=1 Tax=Actinidia rufa TaxID=165716 RepID=A0A7J0F8H0_9ERIC|nr:hypothetical protein Acr_10g0003260 [Actinidia rufa]
MSFFHVEEDSVIDAAPFVLGQYCGFGTDLLSHESGEIAQHHEWVVPPEVGDPLPVARAAGTWSGSKLEIWVRIFRRDFWATQFRKCIPVILERSQEDAMWRAARNHKDRDGSFMR